MRQEHSAMVVMGIVAIVAILALFMILPVPSIMDKANQAGMATQACILSFAWESGREVPYADDRCTGYRCVVGGDVSPTCFASEAACASACAGTCQQPPSLTCSCVDACSQGETRCSGGVVESCGNHDADACLEWGGARQCESGQCTGNSCTPPPRCGDGACNGAETCSSCAADCGACAPVCGDGVCNGAEDCGTCSGDCGACTKDVVLEAESMQMSRYRADAIPDIGFTGARLSVLDRIPGTLTASFPGSSGAYDIIVTYVIENDGEPGMSVSVGGRVVDSFRFERSSTGVELRQRRIPSVAIASGEAVVLTGTSNSGAFARLDKVAFVPVAPLCGDSVVQAGESCDDGNKNMYDACGNKCKACTPADCGAGGVAVALNADQNGDGCGDYRCFTRSR